MKLADNQDGHNISVELKFRPDRTFHFEVTNQAMLQTRSNLGVLALKGG